MKARKQRRKRFTTIVSSSIAGHFLNKKGKEDKYLRQKEKDLRRWLLLALHPFDGKCLLLLLLLLLLLRRLQYGGICHANQKGAKMFRNEQSVLQSYVQIYANSEKLSITCKSVPVCAKARGPHNMMIFGVRWPANFGVRSKHPCFQCFQPKTPQSPSIFLSSS